MSDVSMGSNKEVIHDVCVLYLSIPPGIDHAPSAYQVVEGNELILFCNATGNPKPDITWTKKGKSCELPTSETLTLTKLTREEDQSIYKYLLQPPIQHCSTPVNEGDNVTLNCKGNGNPSPRTLFLFLSKRSTSINHDCNCSHKHYTVLRGSTLVRRCDVEGNPDAHAYNLYFNGNFIGNSSCGVFNISVKEDGEYTCVPVNKFGIGSNGSVSVNVVVSPVAEVVLQAGTVEEGGNITLICNSSGVPSLSVVWTQVGTAKVL
ncbi:peroxidasin homolog [Stylophora pistillata]|uniref:peroxidasin homolog n=1 Tax=Stylophora pistillata TaxID=50429 RepID=UPI000C040E21|nr:peroxidasin homolog [Stylophora pistillata]